MNKEKKLEIIVIGAAIAIIIGTVLIDVISIEFGKYKAQKEGEQVQSP